MKDQLTIILVLLILLIIYLFIQNSNVCSIVRNESEQFNIGAQLIDPEKTVFEDHVKSKIALYEERKAGADEMGFANWAKTIQDKIDLINSLQAASQATGFTHFNQDQMLAAQFGGLDSLADAMGR
jgi:hypothetical protein